MVFASKPVVSVRRLAARPVGAHSNTSIFLPENLQNTGDDRRFTDTRPSGDRRDFAVEHGRDGFTLRGRERSTRFLLDPGKARPGSICPKVFHPGGAAGDERRHHFGPVEWGQKHTRLALMSSQEMVLLAFELDCLRDGGNGNF